MSPSKRGNNSSPGDSQDESPEEIEAEAETLEADVEGAGSDEEAEAYLQSASPAVVLEAEELEAEQELSERRRARERTKTGGGSTNPVLGVLRRLYHGQTSFDFVGRKRIWFLISAVIIVSGVASLGVRGFNLGIDFKGGSAWQLADNGVSQASATTAVENAGLSTPTVEILGGKTLEVQGDLNNLSLKAQQTETNKVSVALATLTHTESSNVSIETVGPTWGGQITRRAIEALIAFFVLVAIYISFRFEPKMAIAAFAALVHDLLVTAGVYSLAGFQVTPDTVIAVLTIMGYSLYDTVVVFDRVRDNSKGSGATGRMTYTEMVNLSMNQTLARSINTSLVAILPVLAVLLVGADLLGAVTLQNYGLALFIGLLSGAYSSIFIASPILAVLKEREPRYATIRHRLETRGERYGLLTPSAAAQLVGAAAGGGGVRAGARGVAGGGGRQGALRPGGASPTGRRANVKGGPSRPAGGTGSGATPTKAAGTAKKSGAGGGPRPVARPRKPGGKSGPKGKKRR